MPDININDILRVPVVNKEILDSLKFILNLDILVVIPFGALFFSNEVRDNAYRQKGDNVTFIFQ